jgi:uncharacterized membrane protein
VKLGLADRIVAMFGTWMFIHVYTAIIAIWILLNTFHYLHIDPFPFILLNLILSWFAGIMSVLILIRQLVLEKMEQKQAQDLHAKIDLLIIRQQEQMKTNG